jgi:hypothetical protein
VIQDEIERSTQMREQQVKKADNELYKLYGDYEAKSSPAAYLKGPDSASQPKSTLLSRAFSKFHRVFERLKKPNSSNEGAAKVTE